MRLGGKWGFVDKSGKEVVPCRYDEVRYFLYGLAAVQLGGKWGFVDKSGKEVVPCRYDEVRDFLEGLAAVQLGGKWGFVDKSGKEVVPCQYDKVQDLRKVGEDFIWQRCSWEVSGALWIKRVRRWRPASMTRCGIFVEGLAAVRRGGQWGFVDKEGQEVVPCRYDEVRDFSGDLAAVRLGGKWGFVDKSGKEVVPCRYDEVRDFRDGPGCGAAGRQVGLCE